ncbi:sensor histidine kinase (plasmid) [Pseudomonas sp. HR96]|uniref:sensor histidine kinase n=1 Tax=Pseudomonas sp. HR96 TaxID=1027966 RepID=UPI002A7588FE|nr:sensor histidine kinase [Pseudomonas sp. HR96]WPP02428.1 sensor histidine kinase [Pseudomonas sp. HR96]
MRLSRFLIENIEPIVQEWQNFARSLQIKGKSLDAEALRDHAARMIRTIAADLNTEQSAQQQIEKSQGHGPSDTGSAAREHAISRLMTGFSLNQVVAEFRALRASVMRHWMKQVKLGEPFEAQDMIRFNEAIDQALVESVASYTEAVEASRDIFLGVLGHDLRSPLSAIMLSAEGLLRTANSGAKATKAAARILTSVERASIIVGDLLDFTRVQLGPGIPVQRTLLNVAPICERIVGECRASHPGAKLILKSSGQTKGYFDGARLEQVFSNLIGNALQHGKEGTPVTVTLETTGNALEFRVHNNGTVIPQERLAALFNPIGQYSLQTSQDRSPQASMGLGLYIAAQIVAAHDGVIEATSDEKRGTEFVVKMPLAESAPHGVTI